MGTEQGPWIWNGSAEDGSGKVNMTIGFASTPDLAAKPVFKLTLTDKDGKASSPSAEVQSDKVKDAQGAERTWYFVQLTVDHHDKNLVTAVFEKDDSPQPLKTETFAIDHTGSDTPVLVPPAKPSLGGGAGAGTGSGPQPAGLSQGRKDMLGFVETYFGAVPANPRDFPTFISVDTTPGQDWEKWQPKLKVKRCPDGKNNILVLAGWDYDQVGRSYKVAAKGGKKETSCNSVLNAMLVKLWGCTDFSPKYGFQIDAIGRPDARTAAGKAAYVLAEKAFAQSPPVLPKPGDIVILRNGLPATGTFGHTGVVCSVAEGEWVTADGGAAMISNGEQAALKSRRRLLMSNAQELIDLVDKGKGVPDNHYDAKALAAVNAAVPVPCFISPTDGKWKMLDGWLDLDKLTRKGP